MNRWLVLVVTVVILGSRGSRVVAEPGRAGSVVVAWGNGCCGQIGDGTDGSDRLKPVAVHGLADAATLGEVVQVAGGEYHSLARLADGHVLAWGDNAYGQLGDDNAQVDGLKPVYVTGLNGEGTLADIKFIAAGRYHSLAVTTSGNVWAWGENDFGQLGDGATYPYVGFPQQVMNATGTAPLAGVVAVAAGAYHSIALTADGTLWAWGDNSVGQAGDGTVVGPHALPVQVMDSTGGAPLGGIRQIDAGDASNLALSSDGTVWAWGDNPDGQLGNGTTETPRKRPGRVVAPGGTGMLSHIVAVAAGDSHCLALDESGLVWGWGLNTDGEVGDGTITPGSPKVLPVAVKGPGGAGQLTGIAVISAGEYHSLALTRTGIAFGWGANGDGQLGDATNQTRKSPVPVVDQYGVNPVRGITALVAVGDHSLAVGRTAVATITGPTVTRSRDVPVSVTGESVFSVDGYYLSENSTPPSADASGWVGAPPTTFKVSPGDGPKTVYGYVRDPEDFVSPAATLRIVLDTASPSASIVLPRFSRSDSVDVRISALDAHGIGAYYLSSLNLPPQPDVKGWTVARPKTFRLPGKDGVKRVFMWVKDRAGNVSKTASDTTFLDRRAPVVRIASPAKDARIASLDEVAGSALDAKPSSGLATGRYAIRLNGGPACKWWRATTRKLVPGPCSKPVWSQIPTGSPWSTSVNGLAVSGSYDLFVEFRDRAGNSAAARRHFRVTS